MTIVNIYMVAAFAVIVLDCEEVWIQDFTPVMGVHMGPGLVGIYYSTYKA